MNRTEAHPVLWTPDEDLVRNSHLNRYQEWLRSEKDLSFDTYDDLWQWSVDQPDAFWQSIWDHFGVIGHSPAEEVMGKGTMPGIRWFEGATLNYAEHIFRMASNERPALHFFNESGIERSVSWQELKERTGRLRNYLQHLGVGKGDRVAAYLANTPDAIIAFLAVNSLGAIWSCCSPDFGTSTVLERFEQIEPVVFIAHDGYRYNGKSLDRTEEIQTIHAGLPSVKHAILIPYLNEQVSLNDWADWSNVMEHPDEDLRFEAVDFNHPIWVLYSSGTTGKPKAITHSHGGVLLEHLKYMHLHNDVHPGEHFFWFTTTGWMMWNFLQASLLAGATAVLYDGSPARPDLSVLWEKAASLPIHHFGTSAPYLVACMKQGLEPGEHFDLSALRSIGSTGAPLPPEAFDWVYESVSDNVWLCSMSGGTDVCTAFVGGIPGKSVRRGLIQGRALGCHMIAADENGDPVTGSLGEMLIQTPMPSMPVFFWGDEGHKRYHNSYFENFPPHWCHGDWIRMYEDGSLIIQGRSDATLNRKGIRIGTAEIYSVLDRMDRLSDSLIINLEKEGGDDIMPLFVVSEHLLTDEDIEAIKSRLRLECSPRHVPDLVLQVADIPYTLSGKKMEVPVKKALMGMDVSSAMNKDACRNPEAMDSILRATEKWI